MTHIIRTVRGDIAPESLGVCAMHEHILGQPPTPSEHDFVLDRIDAVQHDVIRFRQAGGSAIVEMTPVDYGRNVRGLREIAHQCDIHIVAVTGCIKEQFAYAWLRHQTVASLSTRMIDDICVGCDGTDIRAGLLKAGSSLHQITVLEQLLFAACATAHHATGAAISTHTEVGTMAHAQIDLLTQHGVPVERIVIGHCDHILDLDHHKSLLARGVTIGYDQIGKTKYASDTVRAQYIAALCAAGYSHQLVLSCDIARRTGLRGYGYPDALSYTHLVTTFRDQLRGAGVCESDMWQMFVGNPARILTIAV